MFWDGGWSPCMQGRGDKGVLYMKKRINRVLCRIFGRHWFIIGTDIRDGRVTLECPYCGETLFDYEEHEGVGK